MCYLFNKIKLLKNTFNPFECLISYDLFFITIWLFSLHRKWRKNWLENFRNTHLKKYNNTICLWSQWLFIRTPYSSKCVVSCLSAVSEWCKQLKSRARRGKHNTTGKISPATEDSTTVPKNNPVETKQMTKLGENSWGSFPANLIIEVVNLGNSQCHALPSLLRKWMVLPGGWHTLPTWSQTESDRWCIHSSLPLFDLFWWWIAY